MAQVAVCIPAMRPQNIERVVTSIADSTNDYTVIILATGDVYDAACELNGPLTVIDDGGGTYAVRVNRAFRETNEPYLFLGADDVSFRPGWFEAALRVMETVNGVVGINDLHNMAGVHFLVSRDYVNTLGGCIGEPGVVLHEGYEHTYCDDELRHTAQFHQRWGFATDAVVEHLHPGAGKAPNDPIYDIGHASMSQGLSVFTSRSHLWSASSQENP